MKQLAQCFLVFLFIVISSHYAISQDVVACIFEDEDGNNLDDDGGGTFTGLTIEIYDDPGGTLIYTLDDVGGGCYEVPVGILANGDYCLVYVLPSGMDAFDLLGGDSDVDPGGTSSPFEHCFSFTTGSTVNSAAGVYAYSEICGTVFQDCDADGNDNDGETYDNVDITIFTSADNPAQDADGNNIADENPSGGAFCFDELPPGDYLFSFSSTDAAFFPTIDGGDSDMDQSTEQTTVEITVASGDGTVSDALTVGYIPTTMICGQIFQDCDGNGDDDDGGPAFNDVTIQITDLGTGSDAEDPLGNTLSANIMGDGSYCIDDVPPGDFMITITSNDGDFVGTIAGGDSDINQLTGETGTISYANCDPGPITDVADAGFMQLEDICGLVFEDCDGNGLNDDGEDYDNVVVEIMNSDGTAVELPDGTAITTPVTPSSGMYCFEDVPPGDYIITITSNDGSYFTTTMDNGAESMDSDIDQSSGETDIFSFETCNGPLTEVADAGFYQAGCIGGTFWHDFEGEGMFDGMDSGINGATVTITQGGASVTDVFGATVPAATTNASGDYQFCNLPPGEYDINFALPGAEWLFVLQNGNLTDDNNNDAPGLTDGSVPDVVLNTCNETDIQYVDAAAYQLVIIGGTVWIDEGDNDTYDSEMGVTAIEINLYACDDCGGSVLASGPTDADGLYAFLVPPGEYCVEIDESMFDDGGPLATLFEVCNDGSDPDDNEDDDNNGQDDGVGSGGGVITDCVTITCPEDTPDPLINLTIDFCLATGACDDPDNFPPQLTDRCDEIENDPDNLIICDIAILDAFCGSMFTNVTGNGPNPLCSEGGTPHNITWFGFVAGLGNFQVEIVPLGCQAGGGGQLGMQAGIYTDCSFTNEIWCSSIPCSTDPILTQAGLFIPGQTYYFFFDGCAGSICDFEVNVNCQGACDPFELPEPTSWQLGGCSDFEPCQGGTYSVQAQGYSNFDLQFDWVVNLPNLGGIENFSTDEGVLDYTFTEDGDYEICFTVNNGCSNQSACETFTIIALPDVDFGSIILCGEETGVPANVDFMGNTYEWDGDIEAPDNDTQNPIVSIVDQMVSSDCGCEYMQSVELTVLPDSEIATDQVVVCQDDFPYDYNGVNVSGPGSNQSLLIEGFAANGCDSLVSLTVLTPDPIGDIFDLGCADGGITIEWQGTIEPAEVVTTFTWYDGSDDVIISGTDESVFIESTSGIDEVYLVLSMNLFGTICDHEIQELDLDFSGPDNPEILDAPFEPICINGDLVTYEVEDPEDGVIYTWVVDDGGIVVNGQGGPVVEIDWSAVNDPQTILEVISTDACNLSENDVQFVSFTDAPDSDFSFEPTGCVGSPVVIEYTSASNGSWVFNWDFGTGVPDPANTNDPGPFNVSWPTGGPQTVSLSIEAAPGCLSEVSEELITISPPLAAPLLNCVESLDSIVFDWPNNPGISMYTVNVITGQSGTLDGDSFTVNNLGQGEAVSIEVFGTDANGCIGETATVNCVAQDCDLPEITIMPADTTLCLNATSVPIQLSVSYIPAMPPGTGSWSGLGVDNLTGLFDPNIAGEGLHQILYLYEEDNGCSKSVVAPIEVFGTPVSTLSATAMNYCITENVEIMFDSLPGTPSLIDLGGGMLISGASAGPYIISYDTPGVKTISGTVTNPLNANCVSEPFNVSVTIDPEVVVPAINCSTGQTSIEFSWTPDGVSSYDVQLLDGAVGIFDTLANTYTVDGLMQGDSVEIQLLVLSSNACANDSTTIKCFAEACPTYTASIDQMDGMTICPTSTAFNFSATVLDELGMTVSGGSSVWMGIPTIDPGTGAIDPANIPEGVYTVMYDFADASDCMASSSIQVNVINPVPEINGATLICIDDNLSLSAAAVTGNSVVYNWDLGGGTGNANGAGPFDVSFASAGIYDISLSLEVDGCVTVQDMLSVTVDPALNIPNITCTPLLNQVDFSWDPIANSTEYEIDLNGMVTTQTSTTISAMNLSDGENVTISVTAMTASSCGSTSASIMCAALSCPNIVITPTASDNSVCSADTPTVSLNPGLSGSDGSGTGTWSGSGVDQSGNIDINSLSSGMYTYTYMFSEFDCDFEGSIDIEVFESPTLSLSSVSPDCYLDNVGSISVTANVATSGFSISLNGGTPSSETEYSNLTPGQYSVLLEDDNGCQVTESASISAASQSSLNVSGPAAIAVNQEASFTYNTDLNEDITDIIWTDGGSNILCQGTASCNSINILAVTDGTVCVELFYDTNCMITACANYQAEEIQIFEFSNIFTPNNDGENDEWIMFSSDGNAIIQEARVFDRWGNMVHEEINLNMAGSSQVALWNGKFNGTDVSPGVYVFHVVVDLGDGNLRDFSGDITVIR